MESRFKKARFKKESRFKKDCCYSIFVKKRNSHGTVVQYCLDLGKPDLRKNLDLRKIVATTDFLVHKLFDLRKIF